MKLKFEKLPHQSKAIESIASVFKDCEFKEPDFKTERMLKNIENPCLNLGISNRTKLQENIEKVRKENKLANYGVVKIEKDKPLNLDILMETGTGKTFTFIDSMYRLNRDFGLAKFIVLVPSNAIRAGTVKNLEITREYFHNYYHKQLAVLDYSEQNVFDFVHKSNQNISVLIAIFASFNKITNKIHKKKLERNLVSNAKSYIEAVAKIKPVIIIDEPHRAGGDKTQEFLPRFSAQLIFRFGATFRTDSEGNNYYNLVYALDSASAFKEGLVKSITVHSLGLSNQVKSNLHYKAKTGSSGNYKATLEYISGNNKQTKDIFAGRNLGKVFDKLELKDYIVEKIMTKEIIFNNGFTLPLGELEPCSELKQTVQKKMLEQAIGLHFQKEQVLFSQNIKALSLFFIDRVDDYLGMEKEQGKLAKDFERLYQEKKEEVLHQTNLSKNYRAYLERDGRVHNGYFSRSNREQDNQETIDLILRKKEELLSLDTSLRFIFAKWALQEGWDNPNIFTLTKLAPSASTISKLQQIGRGLRLAVNQKGDRITTENENFSSVNLLDVVVAQDEIDFVQGIQDNISENSLGIRLNKFKNTDLIAAGIFANEREANKEIVWLDSLGFIEANDNYSCELVLSKDEFQERKTKINNEKLLAYLENIYRVKDRVKISSRGKQKVKINKKNFAKFKELWENLNSKAVYRYKIDSKNLQQNIIKAINEDNQIKEIKLVKTTTTKAEEEQEAEEQTVILDGIQGDNMSIQDFFHRLCQNTLLSLKTLLVVMKNISTEKYSSVQKNPRFALQKISEICIAETHKLMVQGIGFEIVETKIKTTSITDENGVPLKEIDLSSLGIEDYRLKSKVVKDKSLFENYIAVDSEIEKTTTEESNIKDIEVFAKLPKIGIDTPIGKYTPDFAFVVQGEQNKEFSKKLYLVMETKGYESRNEIPQSQQNKISVGKKFCEALQKKNKDLNIHFKTKINRERLSDIILEIQRK